MSLNLSLSNLLSNNDPSRYGFGSQTWMMWSAGVLASVSSITYPAISALVSMHADSDKQGLVQGMVTGIRGLCNGLGPAMYGVIFYLFHVNLNEKDATDGGNATNTTNIHTMDVSLALLLILILQYSAYSLSRSWCQAHPSCSEQCWSY